MKKTITAIFLATSTLFCTVEQRPIGEVEFYIMAACNRFDEIFDYCRVGVEWVRNRTNDNERYILVDGDFTKYDTVENQTTFDERTIKLAQVKRLRDLQFQITAATNVMLHTIEECKLQTFEVELLKELENLSD